MRSHPKCWTGDGYVHDACRKPSGYVCDASGCVEEAGTLWGPLWCPVHDVERLDRVSEGLGGLAEALKRKADD